MRQYTLIQCIYTFRPPDVYEFISLVLKIPQDQLDLLENIKAENNAVIYKNTKVPQLLQQGFFHTLDIILIDMCVFICYQVNLLVCLFRHFISDLCKEHFTICNDEIR